ncbi:COX15/CtaA family protein [Vibrio hippocampi]|uniref:Heme A synthase n=1 Tax=Vibrio hippocampi TaxID=654686 RepID=A0ABM8ZMM9_9VIBR|nr:COX15/CtaA family protein [Vibrio hippocampi]CAH0528946.1 Heme A synthase [Vibrio hippocampi]
MKLTVLLKISLIMTLIVIALGAYTRLADAGLGCPDWPGCYGQLTVPNSQLDIELANARFPERAVEQSKAWLEMVHRYFAGTLGLLVFAISWLGIKVHGKQLGKILPVSLSLVIVFQAALGMWTVTLKLMPIIVMAHLLGGFTLFSLLFLTLLRLRPQPTYYRPVPRFPNIRPNSLQQFKPTLIRGCNMAVNTRVASKRLKAISLLVLVMTVVQIMLGGWTSSNYAAVVCSTLPICEGNWPAYLNFSEAFNPIQRGFDNYEFGVLDYSARMTIHVTHRVGAMLVTVAGLILIMALFKHPNQRVRRLGRNLFVMLSLQIALGISNVVFHLPLLIAVLHNLGGALLLLVLIHINYRLARARYTLMNKPVLTIVSDDHELSPIALPDNKESFV